MGNLVQFRARSGELIGHPDHGFGFIRDPGVHGENGIYNGFHMHPASRIGAGQLPSMTKNVAYAPAVWNQSQTSSCTGHGLGGAETTTFAAQGKPLAAPVLPRVRYALGRAVDRTDPNTPLQDTGAQPNSLVRAAGLWGVVLESEDDGGRTATSPDYAAYLTAHINDNPMLGELEIGAKRLLVGYNAIADADSQKSLKVQQALAGKYAVTVAVDAGSTAFQSYDETKGPLDYTGDDPDHEVFLVDYGTVAALLAAGLIPASWQGLDPTAILFLLQNSWGVGAGMWTISGRAWVTQSFVQNGCFNTLVVNLGL
jgi:hypothetical protein